MAEEEETIPFEKEVEELVPLILITFYNNKDLFLRELILNSSAALDKIAYESLRDPTKLEAEMELCIKIVPDAEAKTITIIESGVGMTKADLISSLGTMAKSGTKPFVQALYAGADVFTISHFSFGVGFYSAYLVADKVIVTSKHNDDKQYLWQSSARGSFTVRPDDRGEPLRRGTKIVLHLKKDQQCYTEEKKIKDIVREHLKFIRYPLATSSPYGINYSVIPLR